MENVVSCHQPAIGIVPVTPAASTPGRFSIRYSARSKQAARRSESGYFLSDSATCMVRTFHVLTPGGTLERRTKLLRSRSRADQQNQGKRHLRDNQSALETISRPGARTARAFFGAYR